MLGRSPFVRMFGQPVSMERHCVKPTNAKFEVGSRDCNVYGTRAATDEILMILEAAVDRYAMCRNV